MAAVKVDRVGGIEPLHEFLEVGLSGHQHHVKMIVHENIAVHLNTIERGGSLQDFAIRSPLYL